MPIHKTTARPFAETVAQLQTAIARAGNTVFATIDQRAAAEQNGLSLRPTTLLVFGNPKAGTALMEAFPLFGLELPLKLLVWEEAGSVHLAYVAASELAARYCVSGHDGVIRAMDAALDALTDAVVER